MAQKLTGYTAITVAEANSLTLSKYNDPIEDAREGLTPDEVRKVAAEDCSLIYMNVVVSGWKQNGQAIETPEGINVADYFCDGEYLGPDQDGVEPVFARVNANGGK